MNKSIKHDIKNKKMIKKFCRKIKHSVNYSFKKMMTYPIMMTYPMILRF